MPVHARIALVAIAAMAGTFLPPGSVPVSATPNIVGGSCALSLTADFLSEGERGYIELTVDSGSCVTTFGMAAPLFGDTKFSAISPFVPFTCTNAVGDGQAQVSFAGDSETFSFPQPLDLWGAKIGDDVSLVMYDADLRFAAAAHLVQTPSSVEACGEGLTSVTWTGVLVWEDPVLTE